MAEPSAGPIARDRGSGSAQRWQAHHQRPGESVETLELRPGVSLILSRFDSGEPQEFQHEEPEDVFGFGYHLKAGSRFRIEASSFETHSLDVWACGSPRGARSSFLLPAEGFRTVSLRFDPAAAETYFGHGDGLASEARQILDRVRQEEGVARLAPMSPAAAVRVSSMFSCPYRGTARALYLESVGLELIAEQIASGVGLQRGSADVLRHHRDLVMAARDCLDREFRHPPTIVALARSVGTNEYTLKKAFRAVFGVTIFGYVCRQRMGLADRMLRRGETVSATAHEVGYRCVRSFSAAFKRQHGVSPSSVRPQRRLSAPDR